MTDKNDDKDKLLSTPLGQGILLNSNQRLEAVRRRAAELLEESEYLYDIALEMAVQELPIIPTARQEMVEELTGKQPSERALDLAEDLRRAEELLPDFEFEGKEQ